MALSAIADDAIRRHFAGIEDALRQGHDGHTVADVLDAIERGDAQLWCNADGVLITEVHHTPRALVLHFWLAAGELHAVIELSNDAMKWGRVIGCTRATLTGRRGWERALRNEGWSFVHTVMGRELE